MPTIAVRSGGPARTTPKRVPTKNSKERELQLFVMKHLNLAENQVQYEPKQLELRGGHVCAFDLWVPKYRIHLERTQADTFAQSDSRRRRHLALQSLERKYRQAREYEQLNPDKRVLIVTDATWELMRREPSRLLALIGISLAEVAA